MGRKSLRSTKWTFSFSFLLAAVDRLLPHELHFPCLFLDRSIVSVCPLQELFLSFRRTNSKLTMLRTVIKEKIENVSSRNAIIASSWIIFSNNFFKINFQSKWKKKRLKSWSEIIKWKDYEEAFTGNLSFIMLASTSSFFFLFHYERKKEWCQHEWKKNHFIISCLSFSLF